MTTPGPTPPSAPVPPAPRSRWKRALAAVGLTFALLVGMLGVGAYALYRHFDSNITVYSGADSELGGTPSGVPSASSSTQAGSTKAMNILLMGSDTRIGQGGEGGSASVYSTAQSDVVMLIHLSADRKRALVMSIPRDTWITLPECTTKDGKTKGGFDGKFNEAFTIGGPACTIKAVKQLTNLTVDHFVVVDFNGVKNIINAMGGVQFCLKKALHDPIANGYGSGLDLPAGQQTIMGEQGLAFLRVRHNIGDPTGDIGRLNRQHAFLGAMVRQLEASATLSNVTRLYGLLDAITKSITTDTGLGSLLKLKDLAQSVGSMKPQDVTFVTIPWRDRGDGENVLISYGAANPILNAIRLDQPYPPTTTSPAPTPSDTSSPSPSASSNPLQTPPSAVHVRVLNASGVNGAAQRAADALAKLGFQVDSVGTATGHSSTTYVKYSPSYDESGRTLTAAVVGATSQADPSLSKTLVLVVGKNWVGVHAVTVPTSGGSGSGSTSSSPSPSASVPAKAALITAGDSGCV
jgi:LCP family protein required for cell wall assembly